MMNKGKVFLYPVNLMDTGFLLWIREKDVKELIGCYIHTAFISGCSFQWFIPTPRDGLNLHPGGE